MNFSTKSKLLVVDDSAFMRKLITDFFANHPKVEVVGTARNGKDAIKKIQQLSPNVVTMDVEMPEMNGLDALEEIMKICPVPIVMLSSTTQRGAENTVRAMELGAVDFVAKPSGAISLDLHKIKEELVRKVESAIHVPIARLQRKISSTPPKIENDTEKRVSNTIVTKKNPTPIVKPQIPKTLSNQKVNWGKAGKKIVLIGTSTGGPRALQEVITKIPSTISAPILIVQHMPPGFTKSLATRLDQLSNIHVKEAENGDVLVNGTAYIAPGGYHMKLKKVGSTYAIMLDQNEPPRSGHRPSVDVMFESVSEYNDYSKVAVIMTGMGQDGSRGLTKLKNSGAVVSIAESQNTCIVYGMPKAAVETNLVDEVVDVENIAQTIMKYMP